MSQTPPKNPCIDLLKEIEEQQYRADQQSHEDKIKQHSFTRSEGQPIAGEDYTDQEHSQGNRNQPAFIFESAGQMVNREMIESDCEYYRADPPGEHDDRRDTGYRKQ